MRDYCTVFGGVLNLEILWSCVNWFSLDCGSFSVVISETCDVVCGSNGACYKLSTQ